MNLFELSVVFAIIIIGVWVYNSTYTVSEHFTMSPCPNCGKRDKFQCFQCDECVWCWNKKGYGQCVPGNENGPYFSQDCYAWQSQPDPYRDYQYYLPGWRRWWWWTASQRTRDRLNNRYNFRQENVI